MEVSQSTRQFKYNGVTLQDPGPAYSLEQVREFYSTLYPEIVNAAIEGPTLSGAATVYEFRRAVGTKGAGLVARVDRLIERRFSRDKRGLVKACPTIQTRVHRDVVCALDSQLSWHRQPVSLPIAPPSDCTPLLP